MTLEDAFLVNSGRLSVTRSMDLQGGMFLNAGKFETTAKTATLKDIAYFHNAQNANFNATGQVILHTGNFSNNGNITAQDLNLVSSELVNNAGTIETQRILEINGLGGVLNSEILNGASGKVTVRGTNFAQKGGVVASEVNFLTDETVLSGESRGQIVNFEGKTQNNVVLDFQKGTVSGQFLNNSRNAKFGQLLDLKGNEATLQSDGVIQARKIVADSDDATIYSKNGEINSEKITVNKKNYKSRQIYRFCALLPLMQIAISC
ncbi:MAG: hypothetical protein II453_08015 [Alphaproteobacteria bacterium]|nr:hypothetical protein [Alphaproteobacteria bacterium]